MATGILTVVLASDHSSMVSTNLFVALLCDCIMIDELAKNAAYIGTPGKGILAADESTGTIGKRLSSINKTATGKPFVDVLKEGGVLPGIKVDNGTVELNGTNGETFTKGLDGLAQRCQKYYEAGARFAKWCVVLKIGANEPTELAIQENANGLAMYAAICQQCGLVPIVEPEILVDGSHDIKKCAEMTERVLSACYKSLNDHHVILEGTLLKPNMVTPGSEYPKVAPEVIAEYTVRAMQRTVPAAVPLLYSCSVEKSTLMAWASKEENLKKAQDALLVRCKANSEVTLGTYKGDAKLREGAAESLHVSNYKY
ncbi:hypothetical protein V6N13_059797 [Hibiscus sabdariffa]